MAYLSVGDVARRLNVSPRVITTLFYERRLRDDLCPVVSGRRLIPTEYLEQVRWALVRMGKLRPIEPTPKGEGVRRAK